MNIRALTTFLLLILSVSSCIQEEALNSEAAIDACKGSDVQLAVINSNSKVINIYVHKNADLSKQKLEFTLPQGAVIKTNEQKAGDTGDIYDFSSSAHSRGFTVTSEDTQWTAIYTVNILPAELPTAFHFENLLESADTPYDVFYELEPGTSQETSKVLQWASGNPGYQLTGMVNIEADYPTVQASAGYIGKGVKLETRSTGSFGAMVKMYIAAGNLFIGSFDLGNALKDPRKATNLGFPFYKEPKFLKGYYKFKAGDVYTVNGEPQNGIKDKCDIYAVMYEAEENSFMLNGDNVFDSDKLILLARIQGSDIVESGEWTPFNLPFRPVKGRSLDKEKLEKGKYKLAIVLASSIDGAYFKGAVGSTLYVDELELDCGK